MLLQNGILTGIVYESPTGALIAGILMIVLSALVPYLLGSINTAVLISRLFYGADIRTQGSGNAGLTNMHRVYGKKAAIWVLLGDVLKMVLSLLFVGLFYGMQYQNGFATQSLLYLAGVACILGHIFPIYFKFKGGKGVLCTAAMVLVLSPLVFAVEIVIFLLILLVTHYVSVSSISVGILYPFVLARMLTLFGGVPDVVVVFLTVLVALLILWCHRSNIIRLKEHRENRFYFSKKKAEKVKAQLAAQEAALDAMLAEDAPKPKKKPGKKKK